MRIVLDLTDQKRDRRAGKPLPKDRMTGEAHSEGAHELAVEAIEDLEADEAHDARHMVRQLLNAVAVANVQLVKSLLQVVYLTTYTRMDTLVP